MLQQLMCISYSDMVQSEQLKSSLGYIDRLSSEVKLHYNISTVFAE